MGDPHLRLAFLGAPLVDVEGTPLAVDTRKAVALLAFLAIEGGTHNRDSLAGLLWPEYDNDRARAALRRTLSTLRSALQGAWVSVTRDAVSLDRERLWLDVEVFRRLAKGDRLETLEEAAALCRAPLLAGFGLRDSPAFDDWQSFHAGTLARELAALLDRLADLHAAHGAWPAAIAHAQRRLALDPLHESAHRRLIELYARSGERSLALEQYRACVRILNRELGVAPVEATTALYRAIREGLSAPPVPAPPAVPWDTTGRHDYPLVGRAEQWQELVGEYSRIGQDGRLVAIEGEGGIGKTRIATDLVAWARGTDATAMVVRCFEHEVGLAFGSVIELVRGALRAGRAVSFDPAAAAEAARLLPELGTPPTVSLDDPGAQARFFDGLSSVLTTALMGERPSIVVIDDVHWADAASLDVLAYLGRRLAGRPILLLLTWRPEETPADHPARRLVAEVAAEGSGRLITLPRLAREEVALLVAAAGAPDALSRLLYEETEGLPFFVIEYLNARNDDRPELPLPASVRELLEARLSATSELASQVLAAAAVIGRAFDTETVREVSGRSDEETVGALEELERRGIVAEGEGTRYDFRHEQVRKVAYELTSSGRRRLLHHRAADALAGSLPGNRGASAGVVAQHLLLAGRAHDAAGWFRLAGDHARGLYANAEALADYGEALALGDPDQAGLHAEIGDLLTLAGDYAGALASYEAAAALAEHDQLASLEHRIGLVHHRRGEWELADSSFQAALASLPDGARGARARIVADRSLTAHRRDRDDAAQLLAEEALTEGAESGSTLAQAHNILGILATGRGDRLSARVHLEQSLALANDDPSARAAALNNLALLDRSEGELDRALERTVAALALCRAVGDRHREAALTNNLADLLHSAGRHEEAMAHLKSAVAIFAEIGERGVMEPEIWKLVEW